MHSSTGRCDNPYSGDFSFEDDAGQVTGTGQNGRSNESLLCHNATTPAKITTLEHDFSGSKPKCVLYSFYMHSDFDPDSLIVYFELGNGQRIFLEKGSTSCERFHCCHNRLVPKCYLRKVSKSRISYGRAKAVIEFLPKMKPGKLCVYQLSVNIQCR